MAKFGESNKTLELAEKSSPDKTPSPQYLCVDETKRPRANSDPVGLHIHISTVPEITVTGEDCRDGGRAEDDEEDSFLIPPSPRRRANTCPEDMFRISRARPPTPPPADLKILRNSAGKRFSFNFSPKDMSSVSFAHHRLSKVSEEKQEQQTKRNSKQQCTPSTDCNCSSAEAEANPDNKLASTNDVASRLHSNLEYSEARFQQSCDQCVITQVSDLSVAEPVAETTNSKKKAFTETTLSTDVLANSKDSWKSKDNSRDNSDSQRLKAY